MNRREIERLYRAMAKVRNLQKTIQGIDGALRGYKSKRPVGPFVTITVNDGRDWRRSFSADVPVECLNDELIPILRRIRESAAAELKAIKI